MAEFAPNLDDGELWLPTEIFPDVGVSRRHRRPDHLAYVEDLAHRLAACGLLDRAQQLFPSPKPGPYNPPNPEVLRPGWTQVGPAEPRKRTGFTYDGWREPVYGARVYAACSSPVCPCAPAMKPVQSKVEGVYGQERGIRKVVVNHQGQRMLRYAPARSTGSAKGCGGTGVFLPRVALNSQPKKKPSVRGGGEYPQQLQQQVQQMQQQMQSAEHAAAAVGVGKKQQRMMPCQPPPLELALPAEWTY